MLPWPSQKRCSRLDALSGEWESRMHDPRATVEVIAIGVVLPTRHRRGDSVSESSPRQFGLEEQLEQLLVGITGDTARTLKQYLGPSHA